MHTIRDGRFNDFVFSHRWNLLGGGLSGQPLNQAGNFPGRCNVVDLHVLDGPHPAFGELRTQEAAMTKDAVQQNGPT